MVRIQQRTSKKKYFGKGVYVYERFLIEIPRKFHKLVKPFLGMDLKAEVSADERKLVIVLRKPRQNVSARRNIP